MRLLVVSALLLTLGCAGRTWKTAEVEGGAEEMDLGGLPERAAFDLGCSNGKLRYRKFDDLTVGVTGCGKRGTYVQTCRSSWGECTWILNGAIESTKQKRTRKLEPEPEPKPEPEPEPDSPDEP